MTRRETGLQERVFARQEQDFARRNGLPVPPEMGIYITEHEEARIERLRFERVRAGCYMEGEYDKTRLANWLAWLTTLEGRAYVARVTPILDGILDGGAVTAAAVHAPTPAPTPTPIPTVEIDMDFAPVTPVAPAAPIAPQEHPAQAHRRQFPQGCAQLQCVFCARFNLLRDRGLLAVAAPDPIAQPRHARPRRAPIVRPRADAVPGERPGWREAFEAQGFSGDALTVILKQEAHRWTVVHNVMRAWRQPAQNKAELLQRLQDDVARRGSELPRLLDQTLFARGLR